MCYNSLLIAAIKLSTIPDRTKTLNSSLPLGQVSLKYSLPGASLNLLFHQFTVVGLQYLIPCPSKNTHCKKNLPRRRIYRASLDGLRHFLLALHTVLFRKLCLNWFLVPRRRSRKKPDKYTCNLCTVTCVNKSSKPNGTGLYLSLEAIKFNSR